ncbi:kinase-like domain-containing protein [Gigaspora rosea]|uniref:Kinase-like domain-containing protein n=1 Tax=Gigaspora rosea TaxID=44941 RepID=A0A397VQJ2_9GLOM|nr:kinase-like domain-containing protein [Gigaspora rosea]
MSNNKENNLHDKMIQLTNSFNQLDFIDDQKSEEILWLGYRYEHGIGIGVELDKHKAFTHYLKSAVAGNSMGIFKVAICYRYRVGVEKNEVKFYDWIKIWFDYGKCAHCNEDNTNEAWCQTCDPDIAIQGWTSGNKVIDNSIKRFQLRIFEYERMIEWIPFDRLDNIKKIVEGGYGSVFSATWLDGIRKIESNWNYSTYTYTRTREPSSTVALKALSGSRENSLDFLKEFDRHMKCTFLDSKLKIYGLTQNTETKKYLMVFQFANNGSLHKFLRKNFQNLTWQIKLNLLQDISYDLLQIHAAGYIHTDFHSGNILLDEDINKNMRSSFSDLGLFKTACKGSSEGGIYGVIPYVAQEVLSGLKFTKAADVYGFGIIMSEISTGQRPFDGRPFDSILLLDIFRGLRPGFAPGTPDCYIELAKQCLSSDPQKRPKALDINEKLYEWNKIMNNSDNANDIKKQFLYADKIIKTLPIISPKYPDQMYTGKMINTLAK